MAYADRKPATNQKAVTATVVALLQGAVIVALVNGLAVTFTPGAPPIRLAGYQMPIAPPPPPPETITQTRQANERHVTAPRNASVPLAQPSGGLTVLPVDPGPIAPVLPEPELIATPSPTPSFAPRTSRPRNDPRTWVGESDYPARDLHSGHQGVVRISLAIAADGRVQSCQIVASSGYPGLDAATCEAVSRRARFEPARDTSGAPTVGTYTGSIRWVIPD